METCEHCGGDIALRNPTGRCDHLYYPENCKICKAGKALRNPETWEGLLEEDTHS